MILETLVRETPDSKQHCGGTWIEMREETESLCKVEAKEHLFIHYILPFLDSFEGLQSDLFSQTVRISVSVLSLIYRSMN